MDAYFITGNKGKLKEIERILGYPVKHIPLDLDEIQEIDEKKIIEHKAKMAFEKIQKPVIVWDTSVYLGCLNGFPGPLIKWFWQTVTLEKICQMAAILGDQTIKTKAILAFYDGSELKFIEGDETGIVAETPRGDGGFGWDSIFIPDGSELTFAQMAENDPLFHTFNDMVFGKLKEYLDSNGYEIKA